MSASNLLICKLPVNHRSNASLKAKIAEIDTLINILLTTATKSVTQGNIAEYELDTGQTRTRVKYTNIATITKAVEEYEGLAQFYMNKLNRSTGMVRLMDGKNFRR